MKQFIKQTIAFGSPILILAIVTQLFYNRSGGDLNRLGKVSVSHNYRKQFNEQFQHPINYTDLSELDLNQVHTFTAFTIGDSFSKQRGYGYQNYLQAEDSVEIVNFDADSYDINGYNPVHFLAQIANGDLFEKLKVKYVILQSVERNLVSRGQQVDTTLSMSVRDLQKVADSKSEQKGRAPFVVADIVRFPLYNLLYLFKDNAFLSEVYRKEINQPLFSTNNQLLFYQDDLINLSLNNDISMISDLNDRLNYLSRKLQEKGVKLILLPSPDKFSVYYEYIVDNRYPKPVFFERIGKEDKNYLFVDAKAVLKEAVDKGEKDIYFVDDTHWSPKGSMLIAKKLAEIIRENP